MEEACLQIKCSLTAPHLSEHAVIIIQCAFIFILLQINDFRLWQKHLSSLVLLSWRENQLRSTDGNLVFIEQHFAAGQKCAGGWMSNQMRSK